MPEAIPDHTIDYPHIKPVATREELISLLECASELEHGLACTYLFAAYSLKNDASEGDLTETQAGIVRNWRQNIASAAVDKMLHLAQIANLLTAIGGTPRITHPFFSASALADSAKIGFTLEPFSQSIIDRFVTYERLETIISLPQQPLSTDKDPAQSRSGSENGDHSNDNQQESNHTTIGGLYNKILKSFGNIPAEELFIGQPGAQAKPGFLNLDNRLVAVTDQASAEAAISMIVGAGEGATSSKGGVWDTIRTEYEDAVVEARQTDLPFEPARAVGKNPGAHLPAENTESTSITDPLTVAAADLFNSAYDTLLLMLTRLFTSPEKTDSESEHLAQVTLQFMTTVMRPLGEALTRMPAGTPSDPSRRAGPPFGSSAGVSELKQRGPAFFSERMWQLATDATTLRINTGLPTEIQEATAGLQDLACQLAPADDVATMITALKQIQAGLDSVIQASTNGPYLVTNIDTLKNWLGEIIPTRPQMALCRCGNSANKPFCDGTHARIDFTTQKDPKRVPDHRDTYVGTAVTIFDNRGICAHSGFCTDRLSSAFHVGKDPFVVPNGARMDDIIRAVRSCPSGALSYAIGPIEARNQVDQARKPSIEVSKDGPYRITGGIEIKDGQGNDEVRVTGASREHYSLCRCGHSQNKPFCSGMHWYVNFHDPQVPEDHEPTLFEWVGGLPALTRMTHLFYDKYIPQEPLLQALFGNMAPDHPERVAAWLAEVFGGPKAYSGTYGGYTRMLSQHIGKGITEELRSRWAALITRSADEAGVPADAEFRSAFSSYIEWGSRLAVENSTPGAHPPPHMPMPRWGWGTAGLPSSRISALAPVAEEKAATPLPAAGEAVHFTQHIKPLFRPMDRESMKWAFDLWSYKDVAEHADAILARLKRGTMPCDEAWPPEKVAAFQSWIELGKQE
jgi:CDGSH-type Zn-finger protein/truncated hemoglobin YjbI